MKQMSTKTFYALFFAAAGLIAILFSASCHSTKKQIRKAEVTLDAHIMERDKYCATNYKAVDKTTIKTVYKPGKTIVRKDLDTQYLTVDCPPSAKASTKVIRIPQYVQVDTESIQIDIERESVAKIAVLDSTISDLKAHSAKVDTMYQQQINKTKLAEKKATKRLWLSFIPYGLILAQLVYWCSKQYNKYSKICA